MVEWQTHRTKKSALGFLARHDILEFVENADFQAFSSLSSSIEKDVRLASGSMLVRIQSSSDSIGDETCGDRLILLCAPILCVVKLPR
jgi:hypothetical protein